ncbi:MAG: hypothetical protein JNL51_06840 [Chitinophagaceae bacterium]|nr:hypothetical protein [Chitinophagaceae bacterium]
MRFKLYLLVICLIGFFSCIKEIDERNNSFFGIKLDSIVPAVARVGDTVTVFGGDFTKLTGAAISINSDTAQIIAINSGKITFIIGSPFRTGKLRLVKNTDTLDGPFIEYRYLAKVTTVAGTGSASFRDGPGGSAAFKCPWGLAMDKYNRLLVADSYNRAIRKIDFTNPTEPIVTSVSPGSLDFYSPYNLAVDTIDNTLFVTDFNKHVLKVTSGGVMSVLYPSTLLTSTGVAIGPDRMVYISDNTGHGIIKMDQNGGNVSNVNRSIFTPRNVVFDAKGQLYTINSHVMQVKPDGSLLHFPQQVLLPGWEFVIDTDGNFIQADHVNNRIQKVDRATGKITIIAGSGAAMDQDGTGLQASFNGPMSLVFDKAGNLYVSTYNFDTGEGNKIRKITFE